MNKLHTILPTVLISVAVTALAIGWANDLDYWRRVHTINSEITRPPCVKEKETAGPQGPTETPAVHVVNSAPTGKPTDKEVVDGWLAGAKIAHAADPAWAPPVAARLGDLRAVQLCEVEFKVLQIDDAEGRVVLHQGQRVWLTGRIPGLVADTVYACKALFAPAGTHQYASAGATRTLAAYRYLGPVPERYAAAR